MKIAVAGAGGRMGQALIDAVLADRGLTLAAAFDVPGSPALGRQFGAVKVHSDAAAAAGAADVLVDFTRPEGTLAHLATCARLGRAMVIGTTGFSDAQKRLVGEAAQRIPVAMAANYAVGVNALYKLAESAARILGDEYDVEIIEAHHRYKVDAPSGTALELGRVIAQALGRDLAASALHGRHGDVGARPPKAIGFHAVRGGDIVGEHTVLFAGAGERIEITVRSQSRATYAAGALRAAKWLKTRSSGLYDMFDVLGLR